MEKSVGQMRGMRAELEEMKSETDLALQEKEAGIEELAEKDSQVQKEKDCKNHCSSLIEQNY